MCRVTLRSTYIKRMAIQTLFQGQNTGDVGQEQEKLNKLKQYWDKLQFDQY